MKFVAVDDIAIEDDLARHYFVPENDSFYDPEVAPITEDYDPEYPSLVDRFFTRYYYVKPGEEFAPYLVLWHSNRICMICLAPEHPAFAEGLESLNFNIGGFDRSKNNASGKGKRGAMVLQDDTTLANLTSKTGKIYKIPSCVRSKLVEVNTRVSENVKILETADEGEGYIAILLPKAENENELKQHLLNENAYKEYLHKLKNNEQMVVEN